MYLELLCRIIPFKLVLWIQLDALRIYVTLLLQYAGCWTPQCPFTIFSTYPVTFIPSITTLSNRPLLRQTSSPFSRQSLHPKAAQ
jgi:hypothetical protein